MKTYNALPPDPLAPKAQPRELRLDGSRSPYWAVLFFSCTPFAIFLCIAVTDWVPSLGQAGWKPATATVVTSLPGDYKAAGRQRGSMEHQSSGSYAYWFVVDRKVYRGSASGLARPADQVQVHYDPAKPERNTVHRFSWAERFSSVAGLVTAFIASIGLLFCALIALDRRRLRRQGVPFSR